jgi:hypothetical protein
MIMCGSVITIMAGRWRNRATGKVADNPEAWNGVVFVHVGTWGWFGDVDYFLHDFEEISREDDHGPG